MRVYIIEGIISILIPGLGQIVKGHGKKGLIILLLLYFTLPAVAFLSLLSNGPAPVYALVFCAIFAILLWIYSAIDALLSKK